MLNIFGRKSNISGVASGINTIISGITMTGHMRIPAVQSVLFADGAHDMTLETADSEISGSSLVTVGRDGALTIAHTKLDDVNVMGVLRINEPVTTATDGEPSALTTIKTLVISGNVVVEGDLTVTDELAIKSGGSLVVSGNIFVNVIALDKGATIFGRICPLLSKASNQPYIAE